MITEEKIYCILKMLCFSLIYITLNTFSLNKPFQSNLALKPTEKVPSFCLHFGDTVGHRLLGNIVHGRHMSG